MSDQGSGEAAPSPKPVAIAVSPVVSATALVALLVGGAFWVSSVDNRLTQLSTGVAGIAKSLKSLGESRLTRAQHAVWVERLSLRMEVWGRDLEDSLRAAGVQLPPGRLPSLQAPEPGAISGAFER